MHKNQTISKKKYLDNIFNVFKIRKNLYLEKQKNQPW